MKGTPSTVVVSRASSAQTPQGEIGIANHEDSRRGNRIKLVQLRQVVDEIPAKVLRPGFHGKFRVEVKIQDGVIQNIVSTVEENMR